ncbi:MAG: hypothetical protein ACXAC7_05995 [Candidatus Hodarchaeales archaeon]|jgi:DNA-binding Lrp family transcriptional regulator
MVAEKSKFQTSFLNDVISLRLLEHLVYGVGVEINISELSKMFNKHRNTISNRINKLIEHKVIDRPFCSFIHLFNEHPLMVIEKGDFPRDIKTNTWIEKDPYIWTAYFVKEEEYNSLLLVLINDLYTYDKWQDSIANEGKITLGEHIYPSNPIFLSTKSIIKYEPSSAFNLVEQNFRENQKTTINNLPIDDLTLDLLKALLTGQGIRINENYLAREINVNRRTIQRRIERLINEEIITKPVCRFPNLWVPPEYFQVLSLVEIKRAKKQILLALRKDPHIPFLINANYRRYNLVMFSVFYRMEEHLKWQENYDQRFPNCFGAIKNTYLSPAMTFLIDQEYIALCFIQQQLKRLQGIAYAEIYK